MISEKTYKLLIISKIPFVGKSSINNISGEITDWDLPIQELASKYFSSIPRVPSTEIKEEYVRWADEMVAIAKKSGDVIISQQDAAYPRSLSITKDSPSFLYCRGNIELFKQPSLAIIGTREPSDTGKVICERVTQWFSDKGWVIVSGLALGVDTIAHRSCINSNGKTIVVYGNHLNKIYPAENTQLVNDILSTDGLLVSEYSYDNRGHRSQFVERDRIQAALSVGVILVQSNLKGGSMHASKSILKYGRSLIVLNQSKTDIKNGINKIESNNFLLNNSIDAIRTELAIRDIVEDQIIRLMSSKDYDKVHSFLLNKYQHIFSENKNDLFS